MEPDFIGMPYFKSKQTQKITKNYFGQLFTFFVWLGCLQVVNEKCAVSYQIAAEGGGGIVSARDFVNIRYCDILNGVYVCSGSSFVYFFRHLFFFFFTYDETFFL